MDAVAFIWKRLGTPCESLPEAHLLLRAFNAVLRMAAPSLLFKSEAIVHPDEVIEYVSLEECQLSYNPLQMALTWEALATRDPRLLQQALERRHALPAGHGVGQLRAQPRRHRLDVRRRGCRGARHRRRTRTGGSSTTSTSAGSRAASRAACRSRRTRRPAMPASPAPRRRSPGIEAGDAGGVDRVLLAHAIALSTGGMPLLYLGDEVGAAQRLLLRRRPGNRGRQPLGASPGAAGRALRAAERMPRPTPGGSTPG